MKRCRTCRHDKPLESFYGHPFTADRLMSDCKSCIAIVRRLYVKNNRERVRQWRRAYEKTPQFKERRNYRMRRGRARARKAVKQPGTD